MKRDNFYGDEDGFLNHLVFHLEGRDPVALYQCINRAIYQFQMNKSEMVSFISNCVERCLQLGAVPCEPGAPIYQEEWVGAPKYGSTPTEIHRNVMAEWVDAGAPKLAPWTGVWFGLPSQVVPLDKATPRAK